LISAAGVVGVLVFEVALLLASAGTAARIRSAGEYRVVVGFDPGFREVIRSRGLLRAVGLLVGINLLAAGPLLTLTAAGARGTVGYAMILTAIGLGAVVGGLFSGYLRGRSPLLCLIPAAVGPVALGLRAPLVLVVVAFTVVGAVQSVHEVLWSKALRSVPRAASFEELASLAVLPVGQVLGGVALDRWGLTITAWAVVAGLFALPLLGGVPPPRPRTRPDRADIRTGSPASAASR
jgi:hypothetical protein